MCTRGRNASDRLALLPPHPHVPFRCFFTPCVHPAARNRELEEEKRQLTVSISAREEDILISDRQMKALSARLKEEARASGEAAARAEAVAGELRRALEEARSAAAIAPAGGEVGMNGGDPPRGER